MTIKNVFKQLENICRASFSPVRATGFCPGEGLGEEVCHLPDIFDDAFTGSCMDDEEYPFRLKSGNEGTEGRMTL